MYKYLFGPVPSRRLGMSLGVDLVPKKVCTLDCVYCEVGKTTKLTIEQKEYIKSKTIKEELEKYFKENPEPDYITFSGYGEPTLNSCLSNIVQYIKQTKPQIPIAVLTNGTLLYKENVRKSLLQADLIMPSLDAATEEVFRKINRPDKELNVQQHIDGLIQFSSEFKGKIWLEIFILPEFNNIDKELYELKKVIEQIKPDLVQLNTLDRPGTESNLIGATQEELQEVVDFFDMKNVKIIAKPKSRKNMQAYRKDTETAILETISRRPCTLDDLVQILGIHVNEINKYLDVLSADNKIAFITQERGVFYKIKE